MGRHAHAVVSASLFPCSACACLNFQPNIHAERLKHDEPEVSKPAHAEFFLLHRPAFVQCLFAAASNSEHEREGGPCLKLEQHSGKESRKVIAALIKSDPIQWCACVKPASFPRVFALPFNIFLAGGKADS